MRSWIATLFSTLVMLSSLQTSGQQKKLLTPEEIGNVHTGIQKMNTSTTSIAAKFTQEKNMSFLSEIVKSTGTFFYMKEARIRWEYEDPSHYTAIISDGKIHVDDGKRQNTIDTRSQKGFKELNDMMLQCINGAISSNADYGVQYFSSADGYLVRLEPKSKNLREFVVGIELFIDSKSFAVNAIRLLESDDGDYTYIRFSDRKFNQKLDPQLFNVH